MVWGAIRNRCAKNPYGQWRSTLAIPYKQPSVPPPEPSVLSNQEDSCIISRLPFWRYQPKVTLGLVLPRPVLVDCTFYDQREGSPPITSSWLYRLTISFHSGRTYQDASQCKHLLRCTHLQQHVSQVHPAIDISQSSSLPSYTQAIGHYFPFLSVWQLRRLLDIILLLLPLWRYVGTHRTHLCRCVAFPPEKLESTTAIESLQGRMVNLNKPPWSLNLPLKSCLSPH